MHNMFKYKKIPLKVDYTVQNKFDLYNINVCVYCK